MNKRIVECGDRTDDECTLFPENITHISFLESEDTIAHSILLHGITVTTSEIHEHDVQQHHTEEAEALLWEREHCMFTCHSRENGSSTSHRSPLSTTQSEEPFNQSHKPDLNDPYAGTISDAQGVHLCALTAFVLMGQLMGA